MLEINVERQNALPIISDADIDAMATEVGLVLDDRRRAILKDLESIDIRACPGSGKTTLLVTKLAILTAKWRLKSRGICVLSHTNAAKHEIRSRFSKLPSLDCLNQYPHFVGTIQSFVDQFLGTPGCLKAFGRRPATIDDDRFRFEICKEFYSDRYKTAQNALRLAFQRQQYRTVQDCVGEIAYIDDELNLNPIPSEKKQLGPDTATIKLLSTLKKIMSVRGYFRFCDMDAIANYYLKHHPEAVGVLQNRFPIVFVDEMQDTLKQHTSILTRVFSPVSVLQRVGDDRQAIYSQSAGTNGEPTGCQFPNAEARTLSTSFRISPRVAAFVQNLTDDPVENIEGNPLREDGRHSLFVFSKATISAVLPAFAELVACDVGAGLPAHEVCAVGAVKMEKIGTDKFPATIHDYWADFCPPSSKTSYRRSSLGQHLSAASQLLHEENDFRGAQRMVLESVSRLLEILGVSISGLDIRGHRLNSTLKSLSPSLAKQLRSTIADCCLSLKNDASASMEPTMERLTTVVRGLHPATFGLSAKAFWTLKDNNGVAKLALKPEAQIFRHTAAQGLVEVRVDTIHSVKGETLQAAMILDTFRDIQHLRSLLDRGYLVGKRPAEKPKKQISRHLKLAFVAASRPTKLLCLAMFGDHVSSDHRAEFRNAGWRVVEL